MVFQILFSWERSIRMSGVMPEEDCRKKQCSFSIGTDRFHAINGDGGCKWE